MIGGINSGAFLGDGNVYLKTWAKEFDRSELVFFFDSTRGQSVDLVSNRITDLSIQNQGVLTNGAAYGQSSHLLLDAINQRIDLPGWNTCGAHAKFTMSLKISHIVNNSSVIFASNNALPFTSAFGVSFATSGGVPHVYIMAGGTTLFLPYTLNTNRNTPFVVTLSVDRVRSICNYFIDAAGSSGRKDVSGSFVSGTATGSPNNCINDLVIGGRAAGMRLYSFIAYEKYMAADELFILHQGVKRLGLDLEQITF